MTSVTNVTIRAICAICLAAACTACDTDTTTITSDSPITPEIYDDGAGPYRNLDHSWIVMPAHTHPVDMPRTLREAATWVQAHQLETVAKTPEHWQRPTETLHRRRGAEYDLVLLAASALRASGYDGPLRWSEGWDDQGRWRYWISTGVGREAITADSSGLRYWPGWQADEPPLRWQPIIDGDVPRQVFWEVGEVSEP